VTNPASETHSKALTIWDNSIMVFASPSGEFNHDVINPAHLSGLSHLDNLIVTRNSYRSTGTLPTWPSCLIHY